VKEEEERRNNNYKRSNLKRRVRQLGVRLSRVSYATSLSRFVYSIRTLNLLTRMYSLSPTAVGWLVG
jgi:hypothetical protein